MKVCDLLTVLAGADLDADVCVGPGLRLLDRVQVERGSPDAIYPYVVLLAMERVA